MKYCHILVAALLLGACSASEVKDPVDYVDPFIGTAFHGHTYPGATMPFGAVQLSPDNYRDVWDVCSGYHYDRKEIIGFSHTHLSGTGCADLADVLFHPASKEVDLSREGDIFDYLPFRHKDEQAEPGYYKVFFHKDRILAEMTATVHTGWHRYTWAENGPRFLVIDMHHGITRETIHEVELFQTNPREIRGMRRTTAWTPDQYIYFVARFSKEIESVRWVDDHKFTGSSDEAVSDDRQAVLSFGSGGEPVTAVVGISQVSYQDAEENIDTESPVVPFDFDMVRSRARSQWNEELSSIRVSGGTESEMRTFYTALYHTAIVPNRTSDCSGRFRRQDGTISRQNSGDGFYSTLSLWDVFRAWLPLSSLIYPDVLHDVVFSCLDMYQATGELPIWPLASGETRCMIGDHSIPFIVDAFVKGIVPDLDVQYALNAMIESSDKNPRGSEMYTLMGYIPADKMAESVSTLLEYAYDDWCIGYFADLTGNKEVAGEYYARARNYMNVFDGSTGFFRGRNADGTFLDPFNKLSPSREYTEATAWQYRFFVPHDFTGFSCLLGGRNELARAVDDCFATTEEVDGFRSDITGLIGQYAHGNEPSHHMAYIYNYAGQPWKTQEWVSRIRREMYSDRPDGICGNEDCGQMSAWYVMSSIGLYEVCPGTSQFVLTTPLFVKTEMKLPGGRVLTITADSPSANPYIRKVTLNGREIETAYLTWSELMEGGELHFELSPEPVCDLWTSPSAAPYSLSGDAFVSVPYYEASQLMDLFRDEIEVKLGCRTDGAVIRYTVDGSEPDAESTVYSEPLVLRESAVITARAYREGMADSPILRVKATKAIAQEPSGVTPLKNGVSYDYYYGDFAKTDDILSLGEYRSSGELPQPSLSPADREDYYGIIFKGYIRIPEEGIRTFGLMCDDGGVLLIGDRLVVDNDGNHSVSFVTGRILLKAGYYPFELRYLESYEDQELALVWERDGRFEQIPAEYLYVE